MFLEKEVAVKQNINKEAEKTIMALLNQIDYSAEVVPFENPERMIKLLGSLKGEQLNNNEITLVYEMAETR